MLLPGTSTSELIIIAAIALIVVGPKDLPVVLRKFGQFVGRMRSMAADFRSSFEDMARHSELEELRREVEAMRASASEAVTSTNHEIAQAVSFESDPLLDQFDPYAGGVGAPAEAEPAAVAPEPEAEPAPAKPKRTRKKPAAIVEGQDAALEPPAEPAAPKPARKPRRKPAGDAT